MIEVENTPLEGVKIVTPKRFGDDRGFFVETYNAKRLAEHGITEDFIQDNLSLSREVGTIRGLHFQRPPFAQSKLVSVITGAVFDVVVDLREGSDSYGQSFATELSAENGRQLYVPKGFAHGFCTLTPDVRLAYKVDAYYSPEHDTGVIWNDSDLAIAWPSLADPETLSGKDRQLPAFRDTVALAI